MPELRCERCGSAYPEGVSVCPSCAHIVKDMGLGAQSPKHDSFQGPKLTTCPDCGKEVSARAVTCPHCGAPLKKIQVSWKPDWGFEWKSRAEFLGWPLIHVAVGRKDGKLRVAKGIIAIGQFAIGLVAVAQFGVGVIFSFGQFMIGLTGVGQFMISAFFGVGQFATGYVAIGQFAIGYYVLAQVGFGEYVWSSARKSPEVFIFFKQLWQSMGFGR